MPDAAAPLVQPPVILANGPMLVFGGCYSNIQALRALLEVARHQEIPPARMICTGDIVAYGADPQECVDAIRGAGIATVQGNCEAQLGADQAGCDCGFTPGSACDRLAGTWFAYARSRLDPSAKRWMTGLPERIDLVIGGQRLAIVHGAPSRINRFVFASDPDDVFDDEIGLTGADGVIAGHSGLGFSRLIGERLWHNAGAIGLPANDGTPRGWYSIFTPRTIGFDIATHPLDYDHHGAAAAMRQACLPEDYARAIETGIWPSLDSLPLTERAATATPRAASQLRQPGPVVPEIAVAPDAVVALEGLETIWINTGTLCNITCRGCYIESSPHNDRLGYFPLGELNRFLDEAAGRAELRMVGFTGGEPFMNPAIIAMLTSALSRGYQVLVLTNGMRPMQRHLAAIVALHRAHEGRLAIRVSLDHFTEAGHERLRGAATWAPALAGLDALLGAGLRPTIAARFDPTSEDERGVRAGFEQLFAARGIGNDMFDPERLVLFPELTGRSDVAGVSGVAWSALRRQGADAMCRTARMVVQRKGAARASVVACTLLPYDERFELGTSLAEAARPVTLDHPFCAQFCVFGAASCTGAP